MSFNPELIPDLLGPHGPLAETLGVYEDRPYQRELALEVARLLDAGGRLAIEAPTGIGKSLGYGLPSAAWAVSGNGPVVVSTHTKALQEQLLHLEAPRLEHAVGKGLGVRILKGRSNYLCRRRYEATTEGTLDLLTRLRPWTEKTLTGDFAECGVTNPRDRHFLAVRISSEPRFCAHSGCSPQAGCFFKLARAEASTADLLVINHALLSIHLFGGFDILPACEALIVDEAHGFVRVALDHLTLSIGPSRLSALLESAPGGSGFLPPLVRSGEGESRLSALHRSMAKLESASRSFFGAQNGTRPEDDPRQRFRDADEYAALCPASPEEMEDALGTLLADIRALEVYAGDRMEENDGGGGSFLSELRRFREEAHGSSKVFRELTGLDGEVEDRVMWKEWNGSGSFSLNASPLELGSHLVPVLSEGPRSVIFTSATLAAGTDFSYFAREVGMDGDLHSVAYPSPFAFEDQALVAAVRSGPDPRDEAWPRHTARALDALLERPARKTMALFTSYRDLNRVHQALAAKAASRDGDRARYALLAQGQGADAAQLLDSFRSADRALLLGTASFWEGVDLPGEDLEVLVLTRLPFGVPTDPRFQARAERLEAEGGNPFTDLYLPEAVLRFKQGFGRLIRRRSDRGIVAVLDTRLLGKGYGRKFVASLPLPVTEARDFDDLVDIAASWWETSLTARQGELI